MFRNRYFWLLISLFFVLKTEAKVTLTSIWGDNMVLQQQAEVTFRGNASSRKNKNMKIKLKRIMNKIIQENR